MPMREQLESLVSAGKIAGKDLDPLLKLLECGFCLHRGWGFGRIRELDTVFGRLKIDFADKPDHWMDLRFAIKNLQPIPKDHILARKAEDLAGLRELAARAPKELIRITLQSYGGQATLDQIQAVLVPDVIDSDWRKWWETARRELKKDGHFEVPLRKTLPLVYREKVKPIDERLLEEFRAAKGLKAKLNVAQEALRLWDDMADPGPMAAEMIESLNQQIASHQETRPALALEGIFVRDDLIRAAGVEPAGEQVDAAQVWSHVQNPAAVLEEVTGPRQGRALASFREARPADWHRALLDGLNAMSARLCGEAVRLLVQHGHLEELKERLSQLISQHEAGSELLYWLGKDRSDLFADVLGPEVFRAMLDAIEQDQFNERRASRLRELLLGDKQLLESLIETADIELAKDLTRALKFTTSFDDVDRRSLLARIVKMFPAVQPLISGEGGSLQGETLIVSWPSLERRRAEYRELVEKKLPANAHDIAIARSYGDLRENAEYKAAKEAHRLLMQRKAELERDLANARGTDFSDVSTEAVGIGTTVRLTEEGAPHTEEFHILGAWDSDPENHIVSYRSPIAQALMGKKVGDETTFEIAGHRSKWRVEAIRRYEGPLAVRPNQPHSAAPEASKTPAGPSSPAAEPTPPAQPAGSTSQETTASTSTPPESQPPAAAENEAPPSQD